MDKFNFGWMPWWEFVVGVVLAVAITIPIVLFLYELGHVIFLALGIW